MNPYVIPEPCRKMREIARKELKGNWLKVFGVCYVYYLLTTAVRDLLDIFFYKAETFEIAGQAYQANISAVGSVYQFLMIGAFSYGLAMFMLTFFRTGGIKNSLLFEGFSCIGKTIWLYFLMSIKVFLWALLFVIPGIIAVFRYSQAFFVMCDHPEYSANQCLRASSDLMRGNKMKYLLLLLSFLGWAILAGIPTSLVQQNYNGYMAVLLLAVLSIPQVFLNAYVEVSTTVFYELATRNLVVMRSADESYFGDGGYSEAGERSYSDTDVPYSGYDSYQEGPAAASYGQSGSEENTSENQGANLYAEIPTFEPESSDYVQNAQDTDYVQIEDKGNTEDPEAKE